MLDRAIGLNDRPWLDIEFDEPTLFAENTGKPANTGQTATRDDAGTTSTKTSAAPN
jgi:hypothetical protein